MELSSQTGSSRKSSKRENRLFYILALLPQKDVLVTMQIAGEVQQMFEVKAKVLNKGGMTVESVTAEVSTNPPEGFRLHSRTPKIADIGDILPLSEASTTWLFIGDAAGDYDVSVDAKKVAHEIEKAEEELAQAYEELKKGNNDKAIKKFEEAWLHAQEAIKHGGVTK